MGEASEARLFLSYRRDDAEGHAGRLYDRLNAAFPGRIFRDVSGIDIGVDFIAEIQRAISQSVVLVAVIGKRWLTLTDDQGRRRIDLAQDFVRVEIAAALARKIRIIPVLVSGARMPAPEELPADIAELSRWNALEITEADYDHDIERLVAALEKTLGARAKAAPHGSRDAGEQAASLRQRAETAISVEDWLTAIQALQAVLSLDPNDAAAAARLRWAHEQQRLAGLYSEAQRQYQAGNKQAALMRFREVRVRGGNFRNVEDLISLLERELASRPAGPEPGRKPPSRIRWVLGTIGAVFAVLAVIGLYMEEEATGPSGPNVTPAFQQVIPPGSKSASGGPARLDETERPVKQDFSPYGRWEMVSRVNPAIRLTLNLAGDNTFQVQAQAGLYQFPASAGAFEYSPDSRTFILTGVNIQGIPFREAIVITEDHEDHYHASYSGSAWDLRKH